MEQRYTDGPPTNKREPCEEWNFGRGGYRRPHYIPMTYDDWYRSGPPEVGEMRYLTRYDNGPPTDRREPYENGYYGGGPEVREERLHARFDDGPPTDRREPHDERHYQGPQTQRRQQEASEEDRRHNSPRAEGKAGPDPGEEDRCFYHSPRVERRRLQQEPSEEQARHHHHHEPPTHSYTDDVARRYQWRAGPTDGVYLFVKFNTNNGAAVEVAAQSVVLSKRAVYNMGGRFVGIARRINKLHELAPFPPEAIVVFWFHSIHDANLFFRSDPRMKQQDFPAPAGFCDAWAVVRYYTPPCEHEYKTFMISEVRLNRPSDYMAYREMFAKRFAALLRDYDAQPYVTQSVGAEALRRFYCPKGTILTVHLFRRPEDLYTVQNDSRWFDLMRTQSEMADETTTYFTIDPEACP